MCWDPSPPCGGPRRSWGRAAWCRSPSAGPLETSWTHRRRASRALLRIFPVSEELGRHTSDDRVAGHVVRDDGACAHDGALADRHPWKEHRVHADVRPLPHADRFDDELRLDDRYVHRIAGVLAPEHLRPRAPADVFAELELTPVEVALRTDPGMRADRAAPVVPALQERLIADEHPVADLECLRMQHEHAEPDPHAVPERFAERAHEYAPLPRAGGAVDEGSGRVGLGQRPARRAVAEADGLRDLVSRIGRDLLESVDRLDGSSATGQ